MWPPTSQADAPWSSMVIGVTSRGLDPSGLAGLGYLSPSDFILRGLQISGVTFRGENAGCPGNRAVDYKKEPLVWRNEDPWPKESGGCRGEETADPLSWSPEGGSRRTGG